MEVSEEDEDDDEDVARADARRADGRDIVMQRGVGVGRERREQDDS
jgi:hypothetical protein